MTLDSKQSALTHSKSDVLAEGILLLKVKASVIYARTATPKNSEAAKGNCVLTPTDVSDGLNILCFILEECFSKLIRRTN